MKKYVDITINYLKNIYYKIKKYLLSSENRRKNLTTILLLIVFHLFLLITSSNAYYNNVSGIPMLHAVVGDFDIQKYDYVLKIYIQDANNNENKSYHLVDNIPNYNYKYSSYNCKNNSLLTYDEINKVTSVSIEEKEVCSIYFDLENEADIIMNINVENNIDSNTYTRVDNIPDNNYELNINKSNCVDSENNVKNLDISYSNGVINVNTDTKTFCEIYLDITNE